MKKYTLISFLVCVPFLFYYGAAQNFEEPKRYYKPMEFDAEMRGTFNTTPCLRELLQCWEMITPEMLCHRHKRYMTACELRFKDCEDKNGWKSSGVGAWGDFYGFDMDENCPPAGDEYYGHFGYVWDDKKQEQVWRRAGKRAGKRAANASAAPNDTVMFWL